MQISQTLLIPAAQPPHRTAPCASANIRAEMLRLAIADNPLFKLDTRELERTGPSYTFDTLTSLRAEFGTDTPIYLLLGADAFLGLIAWHRWRELFELTHIVVAHRPGFTLRDGASSIPADMPQELEHEWQRRYSSDPQRAANTAHGHILTQETTALDISASAIRNLVASGKSPRYLLPDNVLDYITKHQLYS